MCCLTARVWPRPACRAPTCVSTHPLLQPPETNFAPLPSTSRFHVRFRTANPPGRNVACRRRGGDHPDSFYFYAHSTQCGHCHLSYSVSARNHLWSEGLHSEQDFEDNTSDSTLAMILENSQSCNRLCTRDGFINYEWQVCRVVRCFRAHHTWTRPW